MPVDLTSDPQVAEAISKVGNDKWLRYAADVAERNPDSGLEIARREAAFQVKLAIFNAQLQQKWPQAHRSGE